jgi:ring-1,2-phenylacetyl-CoA epoxidase subunit PaaC
MEHEPSSNHSSARSDEEWQLLLGIADDELILGWRDSEWTGIAPVLEEDVAFSSIAQNEIGHARAIYQLLVSRSGTGEAGTSAPGHAPSSLRMHDADALAFDRAPDEYRTSPLAEMRFVPDWARTIARRVLYEAADELRLEGLKASSDPAVAGLAAKIDREEAYHRMHAEMWQERLRDEPRYREAVDDLWPYAVAMTDPADRERLSARFERKIPSNSLLQGLERGTHTAGWPELWEEMTEVRRSVPGASW